LLERLANQTAEQYWKPADCKLASSIPFSEAGVTNAKTKEFVEFAVGVSGVGVLLSPSGWLRRKWG